MGAFRDLTTDMGGQLPKRPARQQREVEIAALATRQHGVVSRAQLLDAGLSPRAIEGRLQSARLHGLHRGVYAVGHLSLDRRAHWLAAVLACGGGALLSHRTAAALWGLMHPGRWIEVTAERGRSRPGITVHECKIDREDRTEIGVIPVTTVARTLFDLAEVLDEDRLRAAFEEADRMRLLELAALKRLWFHSHGRRSLRPIMRLVSEAQAPPLTRSLLEERFAKLCRERGVPSPSFNTLVLGFEADALWPAERLIVELDGYAYHRHRAAFERDRRRDAALQAAGYRVVRLTSRRLAEEPAELAAEIRKLLRCT